MKIRTAVCFFGFALTLMMFSFACMPKNCVVLPVSTPTATPTLTSTHGAFTATPTQTFTVTSTPVLGPATLFEDWEGPYPLGDMWTNYFVPCDQMPNYAVNGYVSNAALSICYDAVGGDAHAGSHCLRGDITWTAASGLAQVSPDSGYSDWGFPFNVSASTPAYVSVWLKTDTAGAQFSIYIQDTSGTSSSVPVNTTFYQNGTGANYVMTLSAANTWTRILLPLTAGTSVWSVDPTTMNWGSILDIGAVFYGPASGSFPKAQAVYLDDYNFF